MLVEEFKGVNHLFPEYRPDFFEEDWDSIVASFRTSLCYEELKMAADHENFVNRELAIDGVTYRTDSHGTYSANFVSKPGSSKPDLKYQFMDDVIDLERKVSFGGLFNLGFLERDEHYYFDNNGRPVLDIGFRRVIIPRNGLKVPVKGTNNLSHIYLSYGYSRQESGETKSLEITVGLENRPKKRGLDQVDSEGFLLGESNVLEDIYIMTVLGEDKDKLVVGRKNYLKNKIPVNIPDEMKRLIALLGQCVTGREIEYYEEEF